MATSVVPRVLAAPSVDEKHQVLCSGVYDHFSTKYGTRSRREPRRKRVTSAVSRREHGLGKKETKLDDSSEKQRETVLTNRAFAI